MDNQMSVYEIILTRRSTRAFLDKTVEEEKLIQIIEAGRYGPSGGNSQTNHFIVIENKDVLKHLASLVRQAFSKMEVTEGMYKSMVSSIRQSKKGNYIFHYNAPVFIIIANKKEYGNALADSACAIENMMLMANALDLGSCYINQLKWLNEDTTIVQYLNNLGLKEDEIVCCSLSIGYPDTNDGLPQRTPLPRNGNEVTYIK